jgi:RNA polymerase sigma factor (sigma-70 family)
MAAPPLGAALRQIRRLACPNHDAERADRHLLHDFVSRRDEAAFEALVRRHGSLVLRVCQQVLHHDHDAEDAFQATFLIFARRGAAIRKGETLAGWLHKVAFHVASKVRRGATRRRTHESRVRPMTPNDPAPELSWHEVQAILHEEIQRLPEGWKAPFALCVLEGKSRPDAARQLGWKEGTVSSRLARARERLRQRLTRRGVTLSAVLAALAISEGECQAAPAVLIGSTVTTALGAAAGSSHVRTLAEGVLRAMHATKLKTTATLLAVALLTASMGFLTYHTRAAKQPEATPQAKAEAVKSQPKRATLTGTVVDEAGKAVAGAEVELKHAKEPARTMSKADGTFELSAAILPRSSFRLLARHGERLGYLSVDGSELKFWQSLRVVLKAPHRVEVAVADAQGRPLAGAQAGVFSDYVIVAQAVSDAQGRATLRVPADCPVECVYAWKHGLGFDYRSYLKSRDTSDRHAKAPAVPATAIPLKLDWARTLRVTAKDADGKPIANMRLYPWYLTKPGETTHINIAGAAEEFGATTNDQGVATWDWLPNWETHPVTIWPRSADHAQRRLSWDPKAGDTATLVLDRLEWLRGKVTHFNGAPAADITIQIDGEGYDFDGFRGETKTGTDGRYAVRVPPNLIYLLVVMDKKWAAEPQTGFAVRPKTPTPDKDFVLRPATRVTGRVTLGNEKKPLDGQFMILRQKGANLLDRPDLELPNPQKSRRYVEASVSQTTTTGADGRFEFHVGPGKYNLIGPNQVKPAEFTITDQAQVEFNFHSPREETGVVKGLVVDAASPDSKSPPVPNAVVAGVYKASVAARDFALTTNAAGRFEGERRRYRMVLHAKSADGKLAGMVEVGPDDATVTVPLLQVATARGRLLDGETGEPLAGREIVYGVNVPSGDEPNAPFRTAFGGRVITDRDGRFALKGLAAGQKYVVNVTIEKDRSWRGVQTLVPEAGQAVDLGDVRLAPERRPPTVTESRSAAFEVKGTPPERFEAARKEVRLSRQHVLVIFANPADLLTEQLFALTRDRSALRNAMDDFRTLWVATDAARLAAAQPLAKKLGADLRPEAAPVLVVADERGEPVAVLKDGALLRDGKIHGPGVREFLEGKAPERLDADQLLNDALARARKENKRVLVQETATWCGPCWRLSRFLDKHRDVWEKDYLWVKLDHRWKNAAEIAKRLRKGAQGGIPWTAILDADGKVLATGNDKDGQNIGYPTDPAAVAHFAAMLRSTAQRLTAADITRLTEALRAANAP